MVSIANQRSFSDVTDHTHTHTLNEENDITSSKQHLIESAVLSNGSTWSKARLKRQFPGVGIIILYILMLAVFQVMIFVCYDVLHLKLLGGVQEPFAFLTVIHVVVWLISFVYDRYLHFHHHALRKFGYLDLFLKTKEIRRVPMILFSTGNAVLLLIVAFTASRSEEDFSLVRIFQVIASLEVVLCLIFEGVYLYHVRNFNKLDEMPDVYNSDSTGAFKVDIHDTPEVGFSDNNGSDDVLEKQAEMIQYLQQHNRNLAKRIVQLTHALPDGDQATILRKSNVNPNLLLQTND